MPFAGLAQTTYPNKPGRIIVPYSPGGAADVIARVTSTFLEKKWKQPFIIENKPGAFAAIGVEALAKSPGDGYTLLYASSNIVAEEMINKEWRHKVDRDYAPVTIYTGAGLLIAVAASTPFKTLRELVDFAKKNPGKLNHGAIGVNVDLETLRSLIGLDKAETITYKGGAPLSQALAAGEVDFTGSAPTEVVTLAKAGRVRILAYTGRGRHPLAPEVPTVNESGVGLSDFFGGFWLGQFSPMGVSPEIVGRLNDAMAEMMKTPDALQRARDLGLETFVYTQAESRREIETLKKRTQALLDRGIQLR